ncbi:MAG: HAD-IIIA family hydrolase [Clostridia bacterium]|nr:HAD-IIIA family hydrolase [Clostridia bacterium]
MKTVLMAGGKGTRISSVASDIPKPMIRIGGKPVLEREIECLRTQNFTDLIITVGHLGHVIMDYFGDGSRFGVNIEYYIEDHPLGNAGALYKLKNCLKEDFLLLNGDVIFDIDFNRFVQYHHAKGGVATLFTHPNSHPYDSALVLCNKENQVEKWITRENIRPQYYKNRVNAGLHVLSPKILEKKVYQEKIDLDRDLLQPLAGTGAMYAYDSPEYVKDMGTPDRYETVCNDFRMGYVQAKNLRRKQRAIFLDRDGTINRYVGFLTDIEHFELYKGVEEAIRKINNSGYLAIVVTNQPVIARGEVTTIELETIHQKMETLLGQGGAYLDAIYYCPHHPHRGYVGEISKLKIDCECRKPKPGMLLQAANDFNIDLSKSWMIGDSENDVSCGEKAGCKTVLLRGGEGTTITAKDLLAAVNMIIEM